MKKATKTRPSGEIKDAISRLETLGGDPIVDAVVAALRWAVGEGEWREIWSELEAKHGPRASEEERHA